MLRRSWETKKKIIKELNNRLNENRIISEQEDSEKDFENAKVFAKGLADWWDSEEQYNFFCRYNKHELFRREKEIANQAESFGIWSKYMLNKYIPETNKYYTDLEKWITDIVDQIDDIFQNVSYLTLKSDDGDIFTIDIDPEVTNYSCVENKRKNKDFKLNLSIGSQKNEPQPGYNLKVKEANSSSVTLTWEDKTDDIDSTQEDTFEVWRNKYGKAKDDVRNAWQKLDSVPGGEDGDIIEYTDLDVDGEKEYGYKVYARNESGLSTNTSNIVWVTPNKWTSSGGTTSSGSTDGGSSGGSGSTDGGSQGGTITFTETSVEKLDDITDDSNTFIKVGTKGDIVELIQTLLKQEGIEPGPIDKKYGTKTKNAIKKFQKKYGITDDGVVGPKTAEKLKITQENFNRNIANISTDETNFKENAKKIKLSIPSLDVDNFMNNFQKYKSELGKPEKTNSNFNEIVGQQTDIATTNESKENSKPILEMMRRMNIIK